VGRGGRNGLEGYLHMVLRFAAECRAIGSSDVSDAIIEI
jgi:hypothetical protein